LNVATTYVKFRERSAMILTGQNTKISYEYSRIICYQLKIAMAASKSQYGTLIDY
jgi:hypothetical protein